MKFNRREERMRDKQRLQAAAENTAVIRARVAFLTTQVHRDLRRLEGVLADVFLEIPERADDARK